MTKNKRGEKRDDNSVQVALGELMGIEEERQTAEREEAQKRAAEEARRREEEETRRTAEEEARRLAADERHRAEERAREEETWAKQRETTEREARIRAEAEAQVRAEEVRRRYDFELQMRRVESGRRRIPPWLAPSIAVLALGGVGLFAALYLSVQDGVAARLLEAERTKTSLKIDLEREIDTARAERLNAIAELEIANRRVEDAQRQLKEKCDAVALMSRPVQKPRPRGPSQIGAAAASREGDLKGIEDLPPYMPDDSTDGTIHLPGDHKKDKGKKGP
jgi:hypothetical protein